MRHYFRGWKRKLGVVTLLLACLFMTGWVRSRATYEQLTFDWKRFSVRFVSTSEVVGFQTFRLMKPSTKSHLRFGQRGYYKFDLINGRLGFPHFPDVPYPRHWQIQRELKLGAFRVVTANASWNDISLLEAQIPYFAIVVPLTGLAAYFLISKSRPLQSTLTAGDRPQ